MFGERSTIYILFSNTRWHALSILTVDHSIIFIIIFLKIPQSNSNCKFWFYDFTYYFIPLSSNSSNPTILLFYDCGFGFYNFLKDPSKISRSKVAQGTGGSFKFYVIDNLTPPHGSSQWDWSFDQIWCFQYEQKRSYGPWNMVQNPYKRF